MKTALRPDESIVKEGPANLQRGLETVGGHLTLTDKRLVFESHAFNVQTGATEIELSLVRAVTPRWTKLLGILPVFPNSLEVVAGDVAHRFVLFGRGAWAAAIERARRGA